MIISPVKILNCKNVFPLSFKGNTSKTNKAEDFNKIANSYSQIPKSSIYKDKGLSYNNMIHTSLTCYQDEGKKYDGKLDARCFFIRMKHYGANPIWAKKMVELTKRISESVEKKENFSKVLDLLESGIMDVNENMFFGERRKKDSYYAAAPYMLTRVSRGEEYMEKYDEKLNSNTAFRPCDDGLLNACVNCVYITKIDVTNCFLIYYPKVSDYTSSNLRIVENIYDELIAKENPSKEEVVEAAAKIQWLIAQETPYIRGSDSIANVLTKSIFDAYNLPVSPLKKGISLDFEAFYQNLDEYIKNYPDYFEINPLAERKKDDYADISC